MSFDEERRAKVRREEDARMAGKVARLEQTIYGVPEEEGSGIVRKLIRLEAGMDRLRWALTTASITFAVGTISIILTNVFR